MKKLVSVLLLLVIMLSLVGCGEARDTVEMNSYGGNSITKMYTEGGDLMAVHHYNSSTKITTIYTYNYTYDKTFHCTHVDIVVLDSSGREVYSSTKNPSEVDYNAG